MQILRYDRPPFRRCRYPRFMWHRDEFACLTVWWWKWAWEIRLWAIAQNCTDGNDGLDS